MTIEDRCKVCKDLINWSKNSFGCMNDNGYDECVRYMENRIYAVSVGYGVVTLIEANSNDEAYEKVFGFKRRGDL